MIKTQKDHIFRIFERIRRNKIKMKGRRVSNFMRLVGAYRKFI
jgi:hypothetical protein